MAVSAGILDPLGLGQGRENGPGAPAPPSFSKMTGRPGRWREARFPDLGRLECPCMPSLAGASEWGATISMRRFALRRSGRNEQTIAGAMKDGFAVRRRHPTLYPDEHSGALAPRARSI